METKQGKCIGCDVVREVNRFDVCLECSTDEVGRLEQRLAEVRNALMQAKGREKKADSATPSRGQIASDFALALIAGKSSPHPKLVAVDAVKLADALLAELAKPKGG